MTLEAMRGSGEAALDGEKLLPRGVTFVAVSGDAGAASTSCLPAARSHPGPESTLQGDSLAVAGVAGGVGETDPVEVPKLPALLVQVLRGGGVPACPGSVVLRGAGGTGSKSSGVLPVAGFGSSNAEMRS
mmetsp:Transcript_21241/g.49459  ORF Transcript_21241/g.49459 Transcript_21241/m.49459 type:complete len:130 (-) Transcript_21241:712-1101(-)